MYFIQFYTRAVPTIHNGYSERLIEACGDRAVIIVDGRESSESHQRIAYDECKKRGFSAYSVKRGRTFDDASQIVPVTLVV